METLAICNLGLKSYESSNNFVDFTLCNQDIVFGMIHTKYLDLKPLHEEEVLVRVDAFSCNYRDKSLILTFNNTCKAESQNGRLFYAPFGSEFVGTVLKVGDNVHTLKVGDRVIPDGAYPIKVDGSTGALPTNHASQRFQKFHWSYLLKIPDEMPNEKAASFTIAAQTTFSMIRKLQLKSGEKVLVTAATSNTSLAAISALKSFGVEIYACSTSKEYRDRLLSIGIKHCLSTDFIEKENNNSLLFDAVIDPFQDIYFCKVIKHLAVGGRYITCGSYNQHNSFERVNVANQDVTSIINYCIINNISIMGNCLGTREDLENAIISYQKGQFDIIIDSVFTGTDIIPFLSKSFHVTKRFGKVIYEYSK